MRCQVRACGQLNAVDVELSDDILDQIDAIVTPGTNFGSWQERQLTERRVQISRSYSADGVAEAGSPDAQSTRETPGAEQNGARADSSGVARSQALQPSDARIAFAMRVPRLGYFAAVRERVSLDVLEAGPGHYPTTAWPNRLGTVGIAAHNTFWIPFGQLRTGDEIDLETLYGTFGYRVTGSRVVNPDDRSVLAKASGHQLTLTTCWPLWAGRLARQRLAIFAEEV